MFHLPMILFVMGLFTILVPGVLVTIPSKGSIYLKATIHALIFGLIYHLIHNLMWNMSHEKRETFSNLQSDKDILFNSSLGPDISRVNALFSIIGDQNISKQEKDTICNRIDLMPTEFHENIRNNVSNICRMREPMILMQFPDQANNDNDRKARLYGNLVKVLIQLNTVISNDVDRESFVMYINNLANTYLNEGMSVANISQSDKRIACNTIQQMPSLIVRVLSHLNTNCANHQALK